MSRNPAILPQIKNLAKISDKIQNFATFQRL